MTLEPLQMKVGCDIKVYIYSLTVFFLGFKYFHDYLQNTSRKIKNTKIPREINVNLVDQIHGF